MFEVRQQEMSHQILDFDLFRSAWYRIGCRSRKEKEGARARRVQEESQGAANTGSDLSGDLLAQRRVTG